MSLSRDAIVEHLQQMLGSENVLTDEHLLQQRSIDNFRKLQNIFSVYTMPLPAAAAMVHSTDDVSLVLAFADANGVNIVARTGGTATEGGLETPVQNSVVLDGSQMNEIIKIDPYNMQATAQCGVTLQVLEDRVRELGLTTGHSPQSKPVAQMGGLVATRSIGQFSTLYGGIEDMVVGAEVVFAGGHVSRIKNVPRRAAGPDIRHIVIGNEGALCFITEVTVKLFPYMPENNTFLGWTLKNMKIGFEALREVMVAGYKPSVARLYDPEDAQLHFSQFTTPDDCVLLFMAGITTTQGLISNSLFHLDRFPDQQALLRREPERMAFAIEELLRFEAPLQALARTTTRDAEAYGRVIPKGARVALVWASANRDDRVWEAPDRLDITRKPTRHVAFGEGIHHCIGAPLARLEAGVVFEELFKRVPGYAVVGPTERGSTPSDRLFESLPVEF